MKKNINLLPPEEQKINKLSDLDADVRNFGFWVALSLILLGAFFSIYEIILLKQMQLNTEQIAVKNAELANLKKTPLRQQMEALNLDLQNFNALATNQVKWSNVLKEFASILPNDVTLDKMKIDYETKKIAVEGHAGTRKSVLGLRQNIFASSYFRDVDFPLANLEKETSVKWTYKFYVNPPSLSEVTPNFGVRVNPEALK